MMTTHKRYRSLRRKEYWLAIEQLKQRHPWLAQQVVEPPPGHLRVLGHFLSQCELVMRAQCQLGLLLSQIELWAKPDSYPPQWTSRRLSQMAQ
ncbi:MAG: hypothetical protein C0487_09555 [Leptothrix sp. (in: Bacteria)]|nr:hypothetical protein [Leptothrix sp. (in: b-proteobacteria)]